VIWEAQLEPRAPTANAVTENSPEIHLETVFTEISVKLHAAGSSDDSI